MLKLDKDIHFIPEHGPYGDSLMHAQATMFAHTVFPTALKDNPEHMKYVRQNLRRRMWYLTYGELLTPLARIEMFALQYAPGEYQHQVVDLRDELHLLLKDPS